MPIPVPRLLLPLGLALFVTGKVKEVHIYANGTVVALEGGKELLLDAGVKISATPPDDNEAPST